MSKFKLGQKVTIKENFYAPVNGIITRVETGLYKGDLSVSFGLEDYIRRCNKGELYDVSYEQNIGSMNRIKKCRDLKLENIESGWHGMKRNGDAKEFKKFGVKVPGFEEKTNE